MTTDKTLKQATAAELDRELVIRAVMRRLREIERLETLLTVHRTKLAGQNAALCRLNQVIGRAGA